MQIQQTVREKALAQGLTTSNQLAKKSGVSHTTVLNYWRMPDYIGRSESLCAIAKALGLQCPNELFRFVMTDADLNSDEPNKRFEVISQ